MTYKVSSFLLARRSASFRLLMYEPCLFPGLLIMLTGDRSTYFYACTGEGGCLTIDLPLSSSPRSRDRPKGSNFSSSLANHPENTKNTFAGGLSNILWFSNSFTNVST
jgi:hypothetical protein